MESFPIPRITSAMQQFLEIDKYKWYCRLLKEHAKSGFTVHGTPVPIFVAMRMSYAQEKDNFGMTEMKDLLVPLCNATFLLNSQTPDKSKLQEFQPKYNVTFTASRIKEIFSKEASLDKVIGSHYKIIDSLRAIQKECWKLESYLHNRQRKLRSFLEKSKGDTSDIPDKVKKQYNDLRRKRTMAADKFIDEMSRFKKMATEEEKKRKELVEKVAHIKDLMTTLMREGITEAYEDLVEAVCMAKEQEGFKMVMQQLENVNVDEIVEALYKVTSATYTSPLPMEFIIRTGLSEKLSKIKYGKCDFKEQGYKNNSFLKKSKNDETHLFDVSESHEYTEDCFFPKSGGAYVSPVKRSVSQSKNIMQIKKGYEVKMKLSLMNGMVGFGWTRRNFIHGIKKWGFYYMSEDKVPTFTPYDNLMCTDCTEYPVELTPCKPQNNVEDTHDTFEAIAKRSSFTSLDNLGGTENLLESCTKTPSQESLVATAFMPWLDYSLIDENDVIEV